MGIIDRLVYDHQVLCEKAEMAVLVTSNGMRGELRSTIGLLTQQLTQHVRRERRLAAAGYRALGRVSAGDLTRFAVEHDEELERLHVLKRCLANGSGSAPESLRPVVEEAVEELRQHAHQQEIELFPRLAQIFADLRAERSRRRHWPQTISLMMEATSCRT